MSRNAHAPTEGTRAQVDALAVAEMTGRAFAEVAGERVPA